MELSAITMTARVIEILHPATGENVGVRITLRAISDPSMKDIKRKITDAKLLLERRGKGFKADDLEENSKALLFNAMSEWEWYDATHNGKKPDFNKKNVFDVLETYEWIETQITEEITNEKAFFTNSNAI